MRTPIISNKKVKQTNVILIVVDTLRKDYAKPLEDELKKFKFISYENTIAPAPWTIPTHASLFTGIYPLYHKAHETKNKKIPKIKVMKKYREMFINKNFHNKGYNSCLITANELVTPFFGFTGFGRTYYPNGTRYYLSKKEIQILDRIKVKYNVKNYYNYIKALIREKQYRLLIKILLVYSPYRIQKFLKWPKDEGGKNIVKIVKKITNSNNPKFIFINFMEVHEPYFKIDNPHKDYMENLKTGALARDFIPKLRKKYVKEVSYVTQQIINIMKILKNRGIFDNSLIIVTSDHGQLLGEHNRIYHGTFLYDELLKVPLLIKYPKNSKIKITNQSKYISLIKIKSFILNFLNNKLDDDSILYDDTVFAESYGTSENVSNILTDNERRNIEKLEKYRIAIYYKNFKGIFNVDDWKFEKIFSYDPSIKVTDEISNKMRKEVIKFLKMSVSIKGYGDKKYDKQIND